MERITLFVDVLLHLALPELYTYRIPFEMNEKVAVGKRVVVQFGKKKIYSALVKTVHHKAPSLYSVKYILDVIDENPVVNAFQFRFWEWMSDYYMATQGEIMNAALPSAMKLASETRIVMNPDFNGDTNQLNDREFLIFEALESNEVLTITEVSAIVELKQVVHLLKNLFDKGVILEEQEMKQKFTPKKQVYVIMEESYHSQEKLNELMDTLERKAKKQLQMLLSFIKLANFFSTERNEVSKTALIKDSETSSAVFNALVEKNVFSSYEKIISRLEDIGVQKQVEDIQLSEDQETALNDINTNFKTSSVQLLHGVTGSGKTEIYIRLIDEVIKQGKQVLFLLPEIALTGQIINRLRKYFGVDVGVYHSRYSQNERVEVWNKMVTKSNPYKIVIGARSAVFLPFSNLGLVVIDEEHDTSYKQFDPAPRYNGRDSAIYLAMIHSAKCLLGSATPSVETFHKAKTGKYSLTTLDKRYGNIEMPAIEVVDITVAQKNKEMKSHFSSTLLTGIKENLSQKQQVILFRNRRGFSLRLVCDKCQWSPECKSCDVTLTYHKHMQKLKCHYCGYTATVPDKCPACGSKKLRLSGFGTEKIENELPVFFPDAAVSRMDLDTTRGKNSYMQIIQDFEEKRVDILVGTQMVTKGLDFEDVGLVGVLNADSMINYPDFRSAERAFQMLTQVSGRAGRKNQQGRVIIQSSKPENATIQEVIAYDYQSMYERQIAERQTFNYPPFYRMIRLSLKHKNYQTLNNAASFFASLLKERLGGRVIGPEYPLVARIKNYYIKNIIIKIEVTASQKFVKDFIVECISDMDKHKEYRPVIIAPDVDPY